MSEERRRDAFVAAILSATPILLFLDLFLGINALFARDVFHYYYPAKKVLREIVLGGHFPYWNPFFSAGQPLAANPEHAVFYPLTWLILLPDFIYAFQLLPLLHVLIATFAMYALLRSMELSRAAACIGALSFGIGGLLASALVLFPLLFSIAWLPLTCLFTRRYLLHRAPRDFVLAVFFLGLQLLVGEPTTVFQTGAILGMYALYRGGGKHVAIVGAISLLALAMSAVQSLPTVDHFGDTARARGIDWENVSRWSTPFQRLGELVFPNLFGHHAALDHSRYWAASLYREDTKIPFYVSIYSGLLITIAAAAGLLARIRGTALAIGLLAISIIGAAGAHTPLLRILYDAGIATTVRYPEKFALMLVFTIVVFGARAFDQILRGDERVRKAAIACTAAITFIAAVVALISFTPSFEPLFRRVWSIPPERFLDEMLILSRQDWLVAAARGVLLLVLLVAIRKLRRPLWIALAGLFAIVDLGSLSPELVPRVPISFYREPPAVVQTFPRERNDFRIFHVANWLNVSESRASTFYLQPRPELYAIQRNALAPLTPAAHGLRIALSGDFDLTDLQPANEFTRAMWELRQRQPTEWLNVATVMSNVRYVGIHRDPEEALRLAQGDLEELQPVQFITGPPRLRYYFATKMDDAPDRETFVRKLATKRYSDEVAFVSANAFAPARGVVRNVDEWTNGARIDVEAAGRAFLVMSVTPHKYWRITIDGQPVDARVTNIGYQGVVVPPGRHIVEMRYRNPLIAVGGAISAVTLLALGIAFCRMRGL